MKTLQKLLILIFMAMFVLACDNDPVSNTNDTTDTDQTDNTGDNTDDNTGDDNEEPEVTIVVDNFDSYTAGDQIDVASTDYTTEGVNGTDVIASISTDFASSGANSLYIFDNSATTKPRVARVFDCETDTDENLIGKDSGSVSVMAYIPDAGYVKSSYIYLGTGDSASSGDRFTELVFGGSGIKFRDENGSQQEFVSYEQDTWVDVTIAWEGTAVTITIDGVEYAGYDHDSDELTDDTPFVAENVTGAPTHVVIYCGDNSSTGTYSYFDDLSSELF